MVRHLVFLAYAPHIPQETKEALMRDLAALRGEIDGIEGFWSRPNVSPETSFSHDLTEMFWFDFRDGWARDAYLANETHKAIGARILTCLQGGPKGIFVCDVEL